MVRKFVWCDREIDFKRSISCARVCLMLTKPLYVCERETDYKEDGN